MDSGLRKLTILAKLSRYRKISASEIQKQLADEGEVISLRTVQRDLIELASKFPVCGDESKPIGWYIDKHAELTLPDFDLTTSITFAMADKHLTHLLPPAMRNRLEPYFRTAKQFLRSESINKNSHWPDKIAIHSKGLPLHPTDISESIIESIFSAVLSEQCLTLTYHSLSTNDKHCFTFHPYGIVVRGERSYLIGTYDGYSDIRQLAFNRITHAEKLKQQAQITSEFSLKTFLNTGRMGVIRDDKKLDIKLWITPVLERILTETPLSEDQYIEEKEDDYLVTASIDDTEELRHWILSMCNHITVLSPVSLREEIKDTLLTSISYYED